MTAPNPWPARKRFLAALFRFPKHLADTPASSNGRSALATMACAYPERVVGKRDLALRAGQAAFQP